MTESEKVIEGMKNDHYALDLTGIVVEEVTETHAVCSMPVRNEILNTRGYVMGGALFTLADYTASLIANYAQPVTISAAGQIHYLHGANKGVLRAEAVQPFSGRKLCYTEVTITDEEGTLIAKATFNGYRVS